MKREVMAGVLGILLGIAGNVSVFGDEATGTVAETGFGSFNLNENGTLRKFNLSSSKTQYEPAAWRPTAADEIKVAFTVVEGKRGTVLSVDKATLVKAGPNTIVSIPSPVTVEITEVGRSGVKAKIPEGKIVKFSYHKDTQRIPAGWVPVAGDKANIESHVKDGFGFSVTCLLDKLEKVEATAAAPAN